MARAMFLFAALSVQATFQSEASVDCVQSATMGSSIQARAAQVRHEGFYIWFFAWLVWRSISSSNVLMLFGSTVVDVGLLFGGSVPAVVSTAVHCVIGVSLGGNKMMSAVVLGSALPDANHFVVCVLLPGKKTTEPNTTWLDRSAPAVGYRLIAVVAAVSAGWKIILTQCVGDCGIDCMAYHAGRPRKPYEWRTLRK